MEMMNGVIVSNEMLGTFTLIIVYWIYLGIYILLGSLNDYRLHTRKDKDEKNLVSKRDAVKGVLLQQAVQAVVATLLFAVIQSHPAAAILLQAMPIQIHTLCFSRGYFEANKQVEPQWWW